MQADADSIRADVEVAEALGGAAASVTGWIEGLIEKLPAIIAALLVLVLFFVAARILRAAVVRVMRRFTAKTEVSKVIAGFAFVAVMIAGLIVALGIMDLDKTVTSLLAGAGIVGLALGFAFQDTAQNLIAGIILNVRDEFREGHIVQTNEYMGVVEKVEIRATMIRTFEGQLVVIPNAKVFQNPLVNYSHFGIRRIDLPVGVSYGDDLERARAVATRAVEDLESRDTSRPIEVFYTGFGSSSITFELRFWVPFRKQTDFLSARSEAVVRIKRAFDREDITIPFPIRTLDFSAVGGVEMRDAWPTAGGNGG
ncbi:MAG: mechanosensitive ion channel family protein [Longimicrobiales bacterium]